MKLDVVAFVDVDVPVKLLQKDVVHVFDVDATWFIKIRMKAFVSVFLFKF